MTQCLLRLRLVPVFLSQNLLFLRLFQFQPQPQLLLLPGKQAPLIQSLTLIDHLPQLLVRLLLRNPPAFPKVVLQRGLGFVIL